MDGFDEDLHSVELAGFWELNLFIKVDDEVFIDNAIACCKECEDIFDEEAFVVV